VTLAGCAVWSLASLTGLGLTALQAGVPGRLILQDAALSLAVAGAGAPLAVWGKSKDGMDWEILAMMFPYVLIIVFLVTSCHRHRDQLLPRIHEGTVLALTLNFFYFLFCAGNDVAKAACLYLSPAALLVLVSAFTPLRLGRALRFLLASWYSFMCVVLGAAQAIRLFRQDAAGTSLSGALGVMLLSGSLLVLAAHFSLLTPLIPVMGREQTFRERWRELRRDATQLSRRVHGAQLPVLAALAFLALYAGPLALNARYGWVPHELALSGALALGPTLLSALWRPTSSGKPAPGPGRSRPASTPW
jgi:hypothetical protein